MIIDSVCTQARIWGGGQVYPAAGDANLY